MKILDEHVKSSSSTTFFNFGLTANFEKSELTLLSFNQWNNRIRFGKTHIAQQVDEGVVGAVGHSEPVAAEPDDVDVGIPAVWYWLTRVLNREGWYLHIYLRNHLVQNIVELERQPGEGEESHHDHQHLNDLKQHYRDKNSGTRSGHHLLLIVHNIDISL